MTKPISGHCPPTPRLRALHFMYIYLHLFIVCTYNICLCESIWRQHPNLYRLIHRSLPKFQSPSASNSCGKMDHAKGGKSMCNVCPLVKVLQEVWELMEANSESQTEIILQCHQTNHHALYSRPLTQLRPLRYRRKQRNLPLQRLPATHRILSSNL